MQHQIQSILNDNPLVPVVSFNADDNPVEFAHYLIKKGIHCIEVTLRNDSALKHIAALKNASIPNFGIGAGTVINEEQIKALTDLEVDFMVSPGCTENLIKNFERSGISYLPGVSTPSEIINAQALGLHTLKFFPANIFGGINALKTYQSVFPGVKFCPTGGIKEDTYKDYLELSNIISVGGSWLQKEFIKNNN